MLVSKHLFFGVLFSLCLFFIFPELRILPILVIFLSSVLIDFDHYLYYVFKFGKLNPLQAYKWYMKRHKFFKTIPKKEIKNVYAGFFLFHGVEWILISFLLGQIIHPFFLWVSIGFLFHFCLDLPHEIYVRGTVDKISIIYNYYRFKKITA